MSFAEQKLGVEKASNDGRSSDDSLDYSVIIPAYQGLKTIGDCLASVLQALKGRLAEVVVVESSGDGTAELIRREFPDVRVLAQAERSSAGKARNQGAEAARGKTLFFVDQDCVVPENWIDLMEEHLGEPGVGAVGGSVGIRNLNNLSGCGVYFLEFLYHFPSRRAPERNSNFLLGCNLACRASVFEAVRFPARTLAEDVLFSHAVRVAGWDTVYDPRVQVRHWNRQGWGEFFRYNGRMGRAAAQCQRKLQTSFSKPVLRFPLLVFLTPLWILPKIALGLLSQWQYLVRYLALLPACLVGNCCWCMAFYRELVRPSVDDGQMSDEPVASCSSECL